MWVDFWWGFLIGFLDLENGFWSIWRAGFYGGLE